jgi:hypothetical protein
MKKIMRFFAFLVCGLAFATILTYVVMRLWNWLTPVMFGWHIITFWQALGILFLCKILFGGFRGFRGGPGRHLQWRRRMFERWEQMTPEEREKFRESMRGCGPFRMHSEKQKA